MLEVLRATDVLGPVLKIEKKKDRDHYDHKVNETSSRTDEVFRDKLSPFSTHFKYSNPLPAPPEDLDIVAEYEDMIEEHIQRRTFFFFQQLVVCYQTKLHFELNGAQDQGKSPDRIKIGKTQITRNAAHSSTLPCLIAYDNEAWEEFQRGETPQPEGFIFLKGTDYYRTANATMNMPRFINEADIKMDAGLRKRSLELINRASQGEISPQEALARFIQIALEEIEDAKKRPQKGKNRVQILEVLDFYEANFRSIEEELTQDTASVLEKLLNIKLEGIYNSPAEKVVLKIRFKAIRDTQVAQRKLIQKVEKLKCELLKKYESKPDHFDAALRTLLINQARTPDNRTRMEKLFNFSSFDFQTRLKAGNKTKFNNLTTELSASQELKKISATAKEIFDDMRTLRTEEEYQRAAIIKELRGMKGWIQKDLGKKVKALFPHAFASQSTISRIESRKRLVTPEVALEFSQVFRVDPGLFMPHFFYD